MDKDKFKGKGNEVMGGAKQKVGDMTGNDDMKAEGAGQEMKGKTQSAVGDVKDKARDVKDALT